MVVLIVDEAHRADLDSLRSVLVVARRLVDARVLMLLARGPVQTPEPGPGLAVLRNIGPCRATGFFRGPV